MLFKISRNTKIQDAQRLTLFRSRPLFSCQAVALHITKIIPCLLRQRSSSIFALETYMCNLNPCTRLASSGRVNRAVIIFVPTELSLLSPAGLFLLLQVSSTRSPHTVATIVGVSLPQSFIKQTHVTMHAIISRLLKTQSWAQTCRSDFLFIWRERERERKKTK